MTAQNSFLLLVLKRKKTLFVKSFAKAFDRGKFVVVPMVVESRGLNS
jgi:hypothetical protein